MLNLCPAARRFGVGLGTIFNILLLGIIIQVVIRCDPHASACRLGMLLQVAGSPGNLFLFFFIYFYFPLDSLLGQPPQRAAPRGAGPSAATCAARHNLCP